MSVSSNAAGCAIRQRLTEEMLPIQCNGLDMPDLNSSQTWIHRCSTLQNFVRAKRKIDIDCNLPSASSVSARGPSGGNTPS